MIEVRVGYDQCRYGGSAQWCTFYISDDFQSFMDYDGTKYYTNCLAPVIYDKRVQKMREEFIEKFPAINDTYSLQQQVNGILFIDTLN